MRDRPAQLGRGLFQVAPAERQDPQVHPRLGEARLDRRRRLDEQVESAIDAMKPLSNEDLMKNWTMAGPDGTVFISMGCEILCV